MKRTFILIKILSKSNEIPLSISKLFSVLHLASHTSSTLFPSQKLIIQKQILNRWELLSIILILNPIGYSFQFFDSYNDYKFFFQIIFNHEETFIFLLFIILKNYKLLYAQKPLDFVSPASSTQKAFSPELSRWMPWYIRNENIHKGFAIFLFYFFLLWSRGSFAK